MSTLLDGFYADLVPKSLEAGLSLILQDLGPLLFLLLFSCFFFFWFLQLEAATQVSQQFA